MAETVDDARFVELLTSSQVRLRSYVLSLIRISSDADDVLQNACVALWEKRGQYDPDREFLPWACGVVLIEVLRYRRKLATDKLMFDEMLINTLAAEYVQHSAELDRRRELLHNCVGKLSAKDRCMLSDRYRKGARPKEIAAKAGRPLTTIYSSLARIRETLHHCVESGLAQDAHPSRP